VVIYKKMDFSKEKREIGNSLALRLS